mmetsp:Transcript_4037/g.6890  ORF Transcript_4037/g.6890 Transcript_4037/m.6890 type:complete len:158 (-) Transcript_4037:456-929(-)
MAPPLYFHEEPSQPRAFITDLRLSPAQRKKTDYGPDYHTLGRGLTGRRIGFEEYFDELPPTYSPRLITQSFSTGPRPHLLKARLPSINQRENVAKATSVVRLSDLQSRIYYEMAPRDGHKGLSYPAPKGYSTRMTHEKKPLLPFRQVLELRRQRTRG